LAAIAGLFVTDYTLFNTGLTSNSEFLFHIIAEKNPSIFYDAAHIPFDLLILDDDIKVARAALKKLKMKIVVESDINEQKESQLVYDMAVQSLVNLFAVPTVGNSTHQNAAMYDSFQKLKDCTLVIKDQLYSTLLTAVKRFTSGSYPMIGV